MAAKCALVCLLLLTDLHLASAAEDAAACEAGDSTSSGLSATGSGLLQEIRTLRTAVQAEEEEAPGPAAIDCSKANETLSGEKGAGYRGCQAFTRTGRTCQRWDSQSPHKHGVTPERYTDSGLQSNYCRNPDGEPSIWCYTTDPKKRWEYCDPRVVGPAEAPCDENLSGRGFDYRGCQTRTTNGHTCQSWQAQSPHSHAFTPQNAPNAGLEGNYCRNPSTNQPTIWCFTTDSSTRWDFCSAIPPAKPCDESLTGNGADYRGCQSKTKSGMTCQRWDERSPHSHRYSPDRYPSAGLKDNYCRNPDGEPEIWCYTMTSGKRWEFCAPLA